MSELPAAAVEKLTLCSAAAPGQISAAGFD